MKKILTLLMLLTVVSFGYSQDENENVEQGKKLPGSVKLNNGEVVEGFIYRSSKIKSQKKVRLYKDVNDKKFTEYKPDQLISYQVADAYYHAIPYEGFTQKTKVFIERTLAGKLSMYTYYLYTSDVKTEDMFAKSEKKSVELDFDGKSLSGEMIMLKENNEQLNLSSVKVLMGFKNVMSKYVSDCPALSQKIANKESGYGVLNVIKIAEENNTCF
jgi:hypothetical protein